MTSPSMKFNPALRVLLLPLSLAGTLFFAEKADAQTAPIRSASCAFTFTNGQGGGTCGEDTIFRIGDKIVENISLDYGTFDVDTAGTISFEWVGPDDGIWTNDQFLFKVNFTPNVLTNEVVGTTIGPIVYGYNISVNDAISGGSYFFDTVSLEADASLFDTTVVVKAFEDGSNAIVLGNRDGQSLPAGGDITNASPYTFTNDIKSIRVEDGFALEYVGGFSPSLTSVTNIFTQKQQTTTVPGPLPLLGAAAAFSFSRKIRNRIKSVA